MLHNYQLPHAAESLLQTADVLTCKVEQIQDHQTVLSYYLLQDGGSGCTSKTIVHILRIINSCYILLNYLYCNMCSLELVRLCLGRRCSEY